MNPETLKLMKESAAKATPGPWGWTYHPDRRDSVIALESDAKNADVLLCTGDSSGAAWGDIAEADADFIEVANPANVSALIAEYERLKEENERLKEQWDTRFSVLCGNCGQRFRGPRDDDRHGLGKCSTADEGHHNEGCY